MKQYNKSELETLNSDVDDSVQYIERVGFLNREVHYVKDFIINTNNHFFEVVCHALDLLESEFSSSKIDEICDKARNNMQYVYGVFSDYLSLKIDYELTDDFYLQSEDLLMIVDDDSSPVASAILTFCDEYSIRYRVEDLAA